MAVPPAVASQSAPEPMAPASPEPKRPRQRDQAAAPAMAQDVTLPQLVSEVAGLHARFARDETFVTGIHSAVDANAIILSELLTRLATLETRADTTETVVNKVAVDAEANDVKRDIQLRTELNDVTTRLGD